MSNTFNAVAGGLPPEGTPLSLAQESLWFLDRLSPGSALYNIAHALRLRGPLEVPALEQSLDEILRRHAILRTRFPAVDDHPSQVIAPELRFSLRPHDLESLSPEAREVERERWLTTEATRPFGLETEPLVRVALLRTAPEDHTLALTLHHIVFDGWSLELFPPPSASGRVTVKESCANLMQVARNLLRFRDVPWRQ
jgi:NRPS condensation-like uncharacterized protein